MFDNILLYELQINSKSKINFGWECDGQRFIQNTRLAEINLRKKDNNQQLKKKLQINSP